MLYMRLRVYILCIYSGAHMLNMYVLCIYAYVIQIVQSLSICVPIK